MFLNSGSVGSRSADSVTELDEYESTSSGGNDSLFKAKMTAEQIEASEAISLLEQSFREVGIEEGYLLGNGSFLDSGISGVLLDSEDGIEIEGSLLANLADEFPELSFELANVGEDNVAEQGQGAGLFHSMIEKLLGFVFRSQKSTRDKLISMLLHRLIQLQALLEGQQELEDTKLLDSLRSLNGLGGQIKQHGAANSKSYVVLLHRLMTVALVGDVVLSSPLVEKGLLAAGLVSLAVDSLPQANAVAQTVGQDLFGSKGSTAGQNAIGGGMATMVPSIADSFSANNCFGIGGSLNCSDFSGKGIGSQFFGSYRDPKLSNVPYDGIALYYVPGLRAGASTGGPNIIPFEKLLSAVGRFLVRAFDAVIGVGTEMHRLTPAHVIHNHQAAFQSRAIPSAPQAPLTPSAPPLHQHHNERSGTFQVGQVQQRVFARSDNMSMAYNSGGVVMAAAMSHEILAGLSAYEVRFDGAVMARGLVAGTRESISAAVLNRDGSRSSYEASRYSFVEVNQSGIAQQGGSPGQAVMEPRVREVFAISSGVSVDRG